MTKEELVDYWVKTSDRDFKAMGNFFQIKEYSWALFVGHLVIEKLLKAYYVKNVSTVPLLSHNLVRICEKAGLRLTKEQEKNLTTITTFNIQTRYPDYKSKFFKKCTPEFTKVHIEHIKKLRSWLIEMIQKK